MKKLLTFILTLTAQILWAQDPYYETLEAEVGQHLIKKEYGASLEKTTVILRAFPSGIDNNVYHSFCLINLGRAPEAEKFVKVALVVDPSSYLANLCAAYFYAATGSTDKAKAYFVESILVSPSEFKLSETLEEIHEVGNRIGKTDVFRGLAAWYEKTYPTIRERSLTLDKIYASYVEVVSDNPDKVKSLVREHAAQFLAAGKPELSVTAYAYASMCFSSFDKQSEALEMALEGYQQYKKNGTNSNHFLAAQAVHQVMQIYFNTGDYEHPLQYLDEIFVLSEKMEVHRPDIEAIGLGAACFRLSSKQDEARKLSVVMYNMSEKFGYITGQVKGANVVCGNYIGATSSTDNAIAVKYGEYALNLSEQYHLEMDIAILGNLGLAYWNTGNEGKQKCIAMYNKIIAESKKKNDLNNASLYLNNLGAMMLNRNLLEEAMKYFEQSVALAGDGRQFTNPQDRLGFYQSQVSSYQFMIICAAQLNNPEKAFQAMEGSRARVLAERLGSSATHKATLADLQNLLKPDEACIMYSLFSGHEVIILTVTKKYAQVMLNDDPRFVGDIRDKYMNKGAEEHRNDLKKPRSGANFEWISLRSQQIYKRDNYDKSAVAPKEALNKISELTRTFLNNPERDNNILNDFLKHENRFLIVPVLNRLSGIKSLLIAPDDVLNFFPFEALRSSDGKYLVEKYNVRYLHSASILQQLEQRNYDASRKPLLAMGGAIYQDLSTAPMPIQSTEDFNLLQIKLMEDLKAGKSLREEYATLFGQKAMNALPGTLEEVKNISKNLPGSEIYAGADMTENRIKAMSKSGELKKYKVLHLATHGFVVNEFPDLSGVAMCVFSKEQDGEDGFLNVGEIANLKLNADLTVLSACQTAQGKIYAGEGVTGLTQSLIIAGSNAALVSLWPVNDTSTMLFMSNFYKEVAKGKQPYVQIVNDLKRKFIKGEFGDEFRHPNYWAPFIYYGR